MSNSFATANSLAVTVHGPSGVLDLVVPSAAAAVDVAREYARQCGLTTVPALHTNLGALIPADRSLADAGVDTGDLLVAGTVGAAPAVPTPGRRTAASAFTGPGALSALWCCVAAATALLAGWCARSPSDDLGSVAVVLLAAGALLGVLPIGRFAAHRVVAAPAFAGAAAFAVVWDPDPERLPMVAGLVGLVAALAAAVGRALDRRAEEALRVWIIVGAALFVLTGLGALAGAPAQLCWSLILVAALLAARFVPGFAVDVPDQYLIDLERLAVTAWSARERPRGRRGRTVVRPALVAPASSPQPVRRSSWSSCSPLRCCWRPRRCRSTGSVPGASSGSSARACSSRPAATGTRLHGCCCASPGWSAGWRCWSSCSASSTRTSTGG